MRRPLIIGLATILLTAAVPPADAMSRKDQALLDRLDPAVRERVEARLGPEQTVRGVLETMILNRLSEEYASANYFIFDHPGHAVTVVEASGERQVVRYDPATLVIIR